MIRKYKKIALIYGRSGREHAAELHKRIETLASEKRYPIQSFIVMERILTTDVLNDVTALFRESEMSIAILTADDCCIENETRRYRLRQNVVMELGMALFHLGRKNCILLSTFDPNDPDIDLPSDISSIKGDIRHFDHNDRETVFQDVLDKILLLSTENGEIPCYDRLLFRSNYFIDYETLFSDFDRPAVRATDKSLTTRILESWMDECSQLPHFEERLLYFYERIGLMPIFGKNQKVLDWYQEIEGKVTTFQRSDAAHCDPRILNELVSLSEAVISYNVLKSHSDREASLKHYQELYQKFSAIDLRRLSSLNPLIGIIFYDFFGLTAMRIFKINHEEKYILEAINCFEVLINDYVGKVDLSLKIWAGFLYFNLGRAYEHLYSIKPQEKEWLSKANAAVTKAIFIRERWKQANCFSDQIKYSLSYEYFVAKLEYIKMCQRNILKTEEELYAEYHLLVNELDTFCNREEKLEALHQIRTRVQSYGSEIFS